MLYEDTLHIQKYKEWFHNHKKCRANAKPSMKLQRKWTAHQIWDEVEEETRQKPNQKEVLKRYQLMMTAIMKGLNKKKLEEAEAKANEWTNQVPNAAVQAKAAEQKGEKMIKQFATEMFAQAGMRLFVLGSWKDKKGHLKTSGFDFNKQLGKGSSFMKTKDWQVILVGWEDFLSDVFDQDQDLEGTVIGGTCQIPKPYYEFDQDRMGLLILPNMDNVLLGTKKSMIQSFLTIHYRRCCGRPKVPVPWSDILKGQSRFISSTYLLDGIQIWEPSKLTHCEANTLLDYWFDQQENWVGLIFQFKAWIDDKGKMCPPVGAGSDDSDGNADDESVGPRPTRQALATSTNSQPSSPNHWPSPLVKGRLRPTKRPCISSAEEESRESDADDHVGNAETTAANSRQTIRVESTTSSTRLALAHDARPMVHSAGSISHPSKPSASAKTTMLAAQIAKGSDNETPSGVATKAG
ncbi:uncharacterized protein BJ212DRAFT_1482119 [Suillus subaureus]|uniref:Uncharacterized protein n=1 Tax=Suillus subaureus TaxID=48587 RepID=A0A9P7JCF5_9AGAM|nr:uncharacterized protein BJ212DRAFT_1482119 [Suillus subaureus]KAG1814384.1 hypothetical protein BJ212DRAFT_1482119 [Suillus subaureus]